MCNGSKKKIRVLVVDDEALIRRSLKMSLENAGYIVDVSETGRRALNKINELDYDIVITDLLMPELDGVEMLTIMEKKGISVPVIIISAYFNEILVEDDFYKGALRCIDKPFDMKNVLVAVQELTS